MKVPIRKKSGNLFNDPRIYIYELSGNIYIIVSVNGNYYRLFLIGVDVGGDNIKKFIKNNYYG